MREIALCVRPPVRPNSRGDVGHRPAGFFAPSPSPGWRARCAWRGPDSSSMHASGIPNQSNSPSFANPPNQELNRMPHLLPASGPSPFDEKPHSLGQILRLQKGPEMGDPRSIKVLGDLHLIQKDVCHPPRAIRGSDRADAWAEYAFTCPFGACDGCPNLSETLACHSFAFEACFAFRLWLCWP